MTTCHSHCQFDSKMQHYCLTGPSGLIGTLQEGPRSCMTQSARQCAGGDTLCKRRRVAKQTHRPCMASSTSSCGFSAPALMVSLPDLTSARYPSNRSLS